MPTSRPTIREPPLVDDPTQDVVGNFPLIFAPKSAALQTDDNGSPGIVDPGDVAALHDHGLQQRHGPRDGHRPVRRGAGRNVTYVADSTTLNGEPVGQPDSGNFPLFNRVPISSADLTPPLPDILEGVINPGESAVVQFDMQVNAGTPSGTLITNQATVYSSRGTEHVLTDGDGNPADRSGTDRGRRR